MNKILYDNKIDFSRIYIVPTGTKMKFCKVSLTPLKEVSSFEK